MTTYNTGAQKISFYRYFYFMKTVTESKIRIDLLILLTGGQTADSATKSSTCILAGIENDKQYLQREESKAERDCEHRQPMSMHRMFYRLFLNYTLHKIVFRHIS